MAKHVIETERFILRPPTPDDVDDWAAKVFADPDVIRYMPKRDITPRQRAERALNMYNVLWGNHPHGGWVITDKSDGQFIGSCELEYLPDTEEVELGYALTKAQWGKGIATEVARACTRFGFEIAGLKEIIAVVVPENTASWRVLERVGFVFEKKAVYYDLKVVYYKIKAEQFNYGDFFYQARRLDEQS